MTRPAAAAVLLLSLLALAVGTARAAEDLSSSSSGDASASAVGAVLIARKVRFFCFLPIDRLHLVCTSIRAQPPQNSPFSHPSLIEKIKTVHRAPAACCRAQRDGDRRGLQRGVEVIFSSS